MKTGAARGIRNNNPLNIEKNPKNKWQGLRVEQTDPRFCQFKTVAFGFRAPAIVLIKYYDSGLDTIDKIVDRWAPDFENDTEAYKNSLSKRTGFRRNQPLNLHDYADIMPLIKAMCFHENGSFPYSQADLDAGLTLAGIPVPKKISKTTTVKASTAIGTATAVSVIAETVNQVQPAIGLVQTLAEYAPMACAALVAAAIGWLVWEQYQKRKRGV